MRTGTMVLVWTAVVLSAMIGNVAAQTCSCSPSTACAGTVDLDVIFTGAEAGDITTLTCNDLPKTTLPDTINNLKEITKL